jgi:hypothetical protein
MNLPGSGSQLVAGAGQPPIGGVTGFAETLDDVLGDISTITNIKTLLDGDADPIAKINAGMTLVNPAIGGMMTAANVLGSALGIRDESSGSKAQRGYETWGAVNDAFLDALGRDAGPSRNMGYNASGIKASNVDDLNFINAFLDSKGLRWGADTKTTSDDNLLRAGGVKGGELIDMYGSDIDRLWGDLTSFYSGYENAPKYGDMPTWGESANTRIAEAVNNAGGATNAFMPGTQGDFYNWADALDELLASSRGSPAQNAYYNPYLNEDMLAEYGMKLAYGPTDAWGYNARDTGRESWGWGW